MRWISMLIILSLLLTGCHKPVQSETDSAGNAVNKSIDTPPSEDLRVYIPEPDQRIAGYDKIYEFTGETSNRDMDLFEAVYCSLSEGGWGSLKEAISHYTKFLSPDNNVTEPCGISGDFTLDDDGLADASTLGVTKHILYDLNLAMISLQLYQDCELLLFFDIQQDGFYAPLRIFMIEKKENFHGTYQIVGNKDVRWLVTADGQITGSGDSTRNVVFVNLDTGYIELRIGVHCRLLRAMYEPYTQWALVAEMDSFEVFTEDEEGLYRIDYNQILKLYINNYATILEKQVCTPIWYDSAQRKTFLVTEKAQWFLKDEQFSSSEAIVLFCEELTTLAELDDKYDVYLK